MEVIAYQWVGYNHLQTGQYKESIVYYKEVVKLASQLGDKKRSLILNAYLRLGNAFRCTDDFEFSRKYFSKALTVAEEMNDKALQKEAYRNLGHVYCHSCMFDAAVKSYLKVQEISYDLGERKEEASACLMLGDTFRELKQHEKAIKSYQTTLNISGELQDKEIQVVAIQRLGKLYLTLASICSKDCDYEKAIKWYEKALNIFGKEPIDYLLQEMALTGLGVAYFNLGDTEKAMESIHQAQKFAKNTDTDSHNVETTDEHINFTEQKASYSPVPDYSTHAQESSPGLKTSSSQVQDGIEDKESENVVTFEEKEPVIIGGRERAEVLMEEACNSSRTERLRMEDLVLIGNHIEISASYVYSRQISTKEPFTEKVRKAMTEDVKKLAYTNLLGANDQEPGRNDGEFVSKDQQIFNFARSEVFKNASTQKPARLNVHLVSYMKSIGQIACGKIRGTCFLVTDALVITNCHVYRMINDERTELGNPNLPITVRFDYLYPEQKEHNTVEVDEAKDTTLENPLLDYKLFRLKQSEGLTDRVPLGPMVRNWQLSDGRVVILGHPEGKEMQEEVCVVVGCNARLDTMNKRHKQCSGVHMTNLQLMCNDIIYQDFLPYDTSFFSGASGSPVFEMNGNIVAMHTQGYHVEKNGRNTPDQQENNQNEEQENIPNQEQEYVLDQEQENISNQEQENICRRGNLQQYALMEFGVQFISICRDLRRYHGENVVKQIFPNYELKPGEEPMDAI
ncbi:tetratricopeptide repeat 28-like [Paramuricea clavata]|uniref:Tetratricopeptide repeat 28-like n=1 Tax=Paramuricea clavata TaxID=317549 RepID=A0A7D9EZW3_PARCT|nr:tetratricopeptide repeat 28-like [Paramuricea clavata]